MQKPQHHRHPTCKSIAVLIAAGGLLTGTLLLRRRRQPAPTAISTQSLVIGTIGLLILVVLLGRGPLLPSAGPSPSPVSSPRHAAAPESAVAATPSGLPQPVAITPSVLPSPLPAVPAVVPHLPVREAQRTPPPISSPGMMPAAFFFPSSTPQSPPAHSGDELPHKSITYSSSAALLTMTEANGRKLEPTSVYADLLDPNDQEHRGYQNYDHLVYAPTSMRVEGQRQGYYNFQIISRGETINLGGFPTHAGIVDTIRHDDNTASVAFDQRRPPGETFSLFFVGAQGSRSRWVTVRKLPVLPGATFTFTFDWQALSADKAALTIAVDTDSDGKAEHTRQLGGRTPDGKMDYEIELTPESLE